MDKTKFTVIKQLIYPQNPSVHPVLWLEQFQYFYVSYVLFLSLVQAKISVLFVKVSFFHRLSVFPHLDKDHRLILH